MSYDSIDKLQNTLKDEVFAHTKDPKKAAGRALGTFIEIISYYLLSEWGLTYSISIERGVAEYGNPAITHNVEFTLHPLIKKWNIIIDKNTSITSRQILKQINLDESYTVKNNILLDKEKTLKNACVIAESPFYLILSSITAIKRNNVEIEIYQQHKHPFAMFECKRVGIEEGNKKGPQTIEKAKQGAYVAQNTSSLQKIRNDAGEKCGIIYENGVPIIKPYSELLHTIVSGNNQFLLKDFTLSVGIVSNHGNWFTSEDQNKELKVLAQSYDWLLFLTDSGLSQFITDLIKEPLPEYKSIRQSFLSSYKKGKKSNSFTKVKMNAKAHQALCYYFRKNLDNIEKWFNVISPHNENIVNLKKELFTLTSKKWEKIL
ncbi:MAG: hypothetical protein LUC88_05495 [Prevotella sp.]|nr:hypothetical protein [Prevotella sp.]